MDRTLCHIKLISLHATLEARLTDVGRGLQSDGAAKQRLSKPFDLETDAMFDFWS